MGRRPSIRATGQGGIKCPSGTDQRIFILLPDGHAVYGWKERSQRKEKGPVPGQARGRNMRWYESELVSDAAPDLGRINRLVRIQRFRFLKENIGRFRIGRI